MWWLQAHAVADAAGGLEDGGCDHNDDGAATVTCSSTSVLAKGKLMRYSVVRIYPVADFERWKAALLEIDPARTARRRVVAREAYQSLDDPNEVLVRTEFASEEAAMAHIHDDLRTELDRLGIEIYPPVFAGREVIELRIDGTS